MFGLTWRRKHSRAHHTDDFDHTDVQAVRKWLFTHPSAAWKQMDDSKRTEVARRLIETRKALVLEGKVNNDA